MKFLSFLKKKVPKTPTWGDVGWQLVILMLAGFLIGSEFQVHGIWTPILQTILMILVLGKLLLS